ncbi:MAG: hypothetical protein NVSMB25_06070 [Thermoleophilaceae bacterium]
MRRLLLIVCVVAVSHAGVAEARLPAQTSLRMTSCQLALTSRDRQASFYAHMRSLPGTEQMWMRFTLHERIGGGSPIAVDAPGLGGWRRSRARLAFGYTQNVNGLEAGGIYAMTVEYRWLDGSSRVIRAAARTSGDCRELGPLSGLQIPSIVAHPSGMPGGELYSVELLNTASTAETGTTMAIFVDGVAGDIAQVELLAPGERRRIALRGPVCAHRVRAVVERAGSPHRASVLSTRCPAA